MRSLPLDTLDIGAKADVASITLHPGWAWLRSRYAELIEKQKQDWGEELYKGRSLDPYEVAEIRGFWKGVQAVLETPARAEAQIGRELKQEGRSL